VEKQEKKKKKKQKQLAVLKEEERESQALLNLVSVLEDLEAKGKYVDIQVCPKCKSPRVRRVAATAGDVSGHMALTPVKYECPECGWRERLVLKATNRPMNVKDVAIMAEGLNSKEKE